MRITSRGNLTVELIRMQRFEVGYEQRVDQDRPCPAKPDLQPRPDQAGCRTDKVELSRESLSSDPWAVTVGRADATQATMPVQDKAEHTTLAPAPEPSAITLVAGSPALAGLGVSLIVPGTLLDVVA